MRKLSLPIVLLVANAATAAAQEGEGGGGLMSLQVNLMFWTLVIFVILFFLLKRLAFGPITAAVEAREKALEDAIEGAKRDRDAAAALLAEHTAKINAARDEAQKFIADARGLSEKMRADLLEQTRKEQADMLERANRDIAAERDKAIAQLRREAVDLALAGAGKVIEQNLLTDKNRQLVESYLASIGSLEATH